MEFEVFRRQQSPPTPEPAVSVQRDGVFVLNQAAYTALGAPAAVELLYAPQQMVIGLRAAQADAPNTYRVRTPSEGVGFLVSGRAFTNYYRIPTTVARRYRARLIDDVLTVDLSDVLPERRRYSARTRDLPERERHMAVEPR